MSDLFANIITEYRKSNRLTQRDLLNFLYQQSPSLVSLDLVTLSRWERAKTVPSMEKRLLILSIINKMDEYFFASSGKYEIISNNLINKVLDKRYSKIISFAAMLKLKTILNSNDFQLRFNSFSDAPKSIGDFFSNRNRYIGDICKKINAQVGSWHYEDKVIGFFIHAPIKNDMFSILSGHIDDMINQVKFEQSSPLGCDALFFFDQVTLTRELYDLSTLRFFILLITNPQYKKVYICIHDRMYLNLMLRLGGKVVCTYHTDEMIDNGFEHSHLVVFDSIKFISNKSVFEFFANVYNKLNRNNPDLLKQLRESNETRSNRFKAYC